MARILLPGLAALLLSCSLAAQSPWVRSKAGFYAQLGFNYIPTYGTLFGSNGNDIVLDHKVSERQLQLYGEYGVTKKTTLILSLPLVFNERGASNPASSLMFAQEDTGSIAGLGNTSIALRHQFLNSDFALAGTIRVGFPAGASYMASTDLSTGYDAISIQPIISIGKGFQKSYAFLFGSYGYRGNDYSHFLNFGAEGGLHLGKIWLIGFSELMYSLENGDRPLASFDALTGLNANNQGWLSLGAKAIWEINRFVGLSVSGAGAAWAKNVPKSPAIGVAAYFKWD